MVRVVGSIGSTNQATAVREHHTGVGHFRGRPVASHVDALQRHAVTEHTAHVGHLRRVPSGQVELFQLLAVAEHVLHVRHLTGVQILCALDVEQFVHLVEPARCVLRAYCGKRFVEHHVFHVVANAGPFGRVGVLKNCEDGSFGVRSLETVAVERQRCGAGVEHGIVIGPLLGEIARRIGSAVDAGIGLVDMCGIEHGALSAYQVSTVDEYFIENAHLCHVPFVADVDSGQF